MLSLNNSRTRLKFRGIEMLSDDTVCHSNIVRIIAFFQDKVRQNDKIFKIFDAIYLLEGDV